MEAEWSRSNFLNSIASRVELGEEEESRNDTRRISASVLIGGRSLNRLGVGSLLL